MLIIIPARGGSKRVPDKNIRLLGGKPLIQYSIEAARELVPENQILVSTDSPRIKNVVEKLGIRVPFLRPAELAEDTAGTYEVLLHALEFYEKNNPKPDKIILLQPTSPFRNADHIKEALDEYSHDLDMVASVKLSHSNPYLVLKEQNQFGFLQPIKESTFDEIEYAPEVWELNGAIFIINVESLKNQSLLRFKKVKKYVMDELASLDIDTPLDWKLAETLLDR